LFNRVITMADQSNAELLRAVDLQETERRHRQDTGADFTEAKEAVVDALLRLTEQHCTGEGPDGEVIYGARPSSKFVSGFLLPRFDQTGQDDETTDIHIATMGIDLQVASAAAGEITVRPSIAVCIRQLPTWQEISDPRHEMMPQVRLSRDARQMAEQRARAYIQERLGELPPIPEDDEEERAGQALAQAADVADRAAGAHQQRLQRRAASREERIAAISALRTEAFNRAFAELGIRVVSPRLGAAGRILTSEDIDETDSGQVIELGIEEAHDEISTAPAPPEQDDPEEGAPPASGAIGALRASAARLDDHFAAPQSIPQKWRRFTLKLGEFNFNAADTASRADAVADFDRRFRQTLEQTIANWLATADGQRDAYRPNERVLPSQFADEASWNRFLADLRSRRPATIDDVRPDLNGVKLIADLDPDFVEPSRANLRVAIQNDASMPSGRDASAFEHAIFQVQLLLTLPSMIHLPLQLDRVQPSYRFRDWLEYPAMGLNCGVRQINAPRDTTSLATTWAPRYVQPRIDAKAVAGLSTSYAELAQADTDIDRLLALPDAYDEWINIQSAVDAGQGLPDDLADEERRSHARDIEAYRRESRYIRSGIELLREAQQAHRSLLSSPPAGADARAALQKRAAPWQAWLRTNETFAKHGQFTDWRLFQLAFILSHLPTFASRTEQFANRFDAFRDELSASLLYFPTGGGKSEAFFGLLIFNLFFDRLRGKHRGVTALVRYPLRLLTLQQARRLMRIVVNAELVRLHHKIAGWPFELGFWVGSGNTPNRVAQGFGGVPSITVAAHGDDTPLMNPPDADTENAAKARRRSARYKEALEAYDKLRKCPCCGSETGMRKYPSQHGRIGIVCFNDANCDWNRLNPPMPHRVPLPLILTDDTIYQRAPSIVLGTVDKLALIGQHDRTINAIVGMFGCARYMDPENQHLFTPRGPRALAKAEDDGWTRLRPAFASGANIFHDPFPSLVIQDEGHLLDESLGTFSGLFETTLEAILNRLGEGVLAGGVATWAPDGSATRKPRLAKVIAATATISDPDRQLRVLYQREPLRFPCPGPTLYESFYAAPRRPSRPGTPSLSRQLACSRSPRGGRSANAHLRLDHDERPLAYHDDLRSCFFLSPRIFATAGVTEGWRSAGSS
jgi:hypothetical protein